MKKLSIIIPVYNEEKTIEKLLSKVLDVDLGRWDKEIIVVDDGSSDKTFQVLSKFNPHFKLIRHKKNRGKGAAIQTGLKHASGDAMVVQDADLEYDPADLPKLLKKYDTGNAAVVFGSRNLKLKEHIFYVWGINLSTFLVNMLYDSNLTDLYTCYKLFDAKILNRVKSKALGFEWDIEIIVKILKQGYKIVEAPISYKPRSLNEGKKIRPWDGIIGLWMIVKNKWP